MEIVKDALELKSSILSDLNLEPFSYILLTIHRAENTDSPAVLKSIVDALRTVDDMTIVFPIHPRTRKILQDMGLYLSLEESKHIRLISPAGYVDFINLMKSAHKVVTDSGGSTKGGVFAWSSVHHY